MYVAVSIAVKDTILPAIPPFVEPFIVITSLVAAGTKAFLAHHHLHLIKLRDL